MLDAMDPARKRAPSSDADTSDSHEFCHLVREVRAAVVDLVPSRLKKGLSERHSQIRTDLDVRIEKHTDLDISIHVMRISRCRTVASPDLSRNQVLVGERTHLEITTYLMHRSELVITICIDLSVKICAGPDLGR